MIDVRLLVYPLNDFYTIVPVHFLHRFIYLETRLYILKHLPLILCLVNGGLGTEVEVLEIEASSPHATFNVRICNLEN